MDSTPDGEVGCDGDLRKREQICQSEGDERRYVKESQPSMEKKNEAGVKRDSS